MSKHTPTPWTVAKHERGLVRAQGRTIVVVRETGNQDIDANAEFIVRACNAHEDLLAALKEIERSLANHPTFAWHNIVEIARAAIAKAEGES